MPFGRLREVLEFWNGPAMVAGPSCCSGLMTALGTEAPNVVCLRAFGLDKSELPWRAAVPGDLSLRRWPAACLASGSQVLRPSAFLGREGAPGTGCRRGTWSPGTTRRCRFSRSGNPRARGHAFWVAFGTLAVLRSNAVNTGQNALRAMLGTAAGIIVGGLLITVIGDHTTAWWILLPLVVAFTGVATAALSFAVGQAGFTLFLLLLFDLIAPTGWSIGVVRIEDMALGCGVSVVG